MRGQGQLLTGLALGAGAMYLLDPDRGARRRSLLRDQGVHAGHKLSDGISATAQDARNRIRGTAAELRARFRNDVVDEEILHERVRSAIGRVVAHPSAVTVLAAEGRVTLQGDILEDEVEDLIKQVQRVRGVDEVENQLTVHRSTEGVPSLQGAGRRQQERSVLGRESWPPSARLLLGAVGGGLTYYAVRSRGPVGDTLGILGLALLARATTNRAPTRLIESLREKGNAPDRAETEAMSGSAPPESAL